MTEHDFKVGDVVYWEKGTYTSHKNKEHFIIEHINGNKIHSKSTGRHGWIDADRCIKVEEIEQYQIF